MLPNVSYRFLYHNEDGVFFEVSQELQRVSFQGNPVYLVLLLPGTMTSVVLCFPEPEVTVVYSWDLRGKTRILGAMYPPLGPIRDLRRSVVYRYGMRLLPWMFLQKLPPGLDPEQDHVVNYVILNCTSGFSGILLRVFRSAGTEKGRDWMEIRYFSSGNEWRFRQGEWKRAEPSGKLIVKIVPKRVIAGLTWRPENGWSDYELSSVSLNL